MPIAYWLAIPLFIFFFFGLQSLSNFATADEKLWYNPSPKGDRIHAYWQELAKHNWPRTAVNDKPGITLAILSGAGILFEPNFSIQVLNGHIRTTDVELFKKTIFFYRLPILLLGGLFPLLFFYYLKKITDNSVFALFASTLILLNPIILGISQIMNPDSLLWMFVFASFLAYISFLKTSTFSDAGMVAIFLGLSFATKYASDLLMPVFFVISILYILMFIEYENNLEILSKTLKKICLAWPLIILWALLLFAVLMPAGIVDPNMIMQKTILYKGLDKFLLSALSILLIIFVDAHIWKSKNIDYLIKKSRLFLNKYFPSVLYAALFLLFVVAFVNWTLGHNFLDIKNLAFDVGRDKIFRIQDFNDRLFLELRPLIYSLTPFVLFSMLLTWLYSIFKKTAHQQLILFSSVFMVMFYVAVLRANLLTHIRYEIMLYPLVSLIVAAGMVELSGYASKKVSIFLIWSVIVAVSSISLFLIRPFYFNYLNSMLPQNNNLAGAWGYGGYEAAQFMNAKPNAKDLTVWSDYDGFCGFFVGKCMEKDDIDLMWDNPETANNQFDYAVRTRRGLIRFKKEWDRVKHFSGLEKKSEWRLNIDDRPKNYIEIIKNNHEN